MRGTLIDCVQSSLLTSRLAAYVGEALHADLLAGVRPGLRAQLFADRWECGETQKGTYVLLELYSFDG